MNTKIIAVVKFNDDEAYVLKNKPMLKYTKYNNRLIIGTDGCFLQIYKYEKPIRPINPNWSGWQAFGGTKFDLPLTDGTIEHCYGQLERNNIVMSEFECRCGGIFSRNKAGVMCCVECGSTRAYRMDGYTAKQLEAIERDFDEREAEDREGDEDEE